MGLYEVGTDALRPLTRATLAGAAIRERDDLQRLLRDQIEVLDPDLLVIAEEFGRWEESRRRIDLLAIDRTANLVVIELKRDETGGHMELQALRYAAMVSTMTWGGAVVAFTEYLRSRDSDDDAAALMLEFLEWDEPDDDAFAQDVRIILAASDFGRELTTAVLWLNQRDVDLRCVRLQPFADGARILLDVQQVIPLPEAADFQVQIREKARRERQARSDSRDLTRYDVSVGGISYQRLAKRNSIFRVVQHLVRAGVPPEKLIDSLGPRPFYRVFRVVDGELDQEAYNLAAQGAREAVGKTHNAGRWYTSDDELLYCDGRTYAFSKMWGGERWLGAMKQLQNDHPGAEIRFSPSEG